MESPWAFAAGNFPTSLEPKPEPGRGRVGWLGGWVVGGGLLIFFLGGIYRDSLGIYKLYIMLNHLNLR